MTFHVPPSLMEYYGDVAVRRAVDALSDRLDGTNMPEARWEEARRYNQALLMAAQVRADLVDLLFRVWDESFGRVEPGRLGEDSFDYTDTQFSLADIWRRKALCLYYYRDQRPPSEGGRSDGLSVEVSEDGNLGLWVVRFQQDSDHAEPGAVAGTAEWESTHHDWYGFVCLANQSVDVRKFLEDPCPALARFRDEARAVVEALRQD